MLTLDIYVGQRKQVSAYVATGPSYANDPCFWTSSNSGIAAVVNLALAQPCNNVDILGVSVGSTTILISDGSGNTGTITVNVSAAPASAAPAFVVNF